jgi:hypothetical protein
MIAPLLHYLFLVLPMLYVVLGGPAKLYDFFLAYIVLTQFHWKLFEGECICSYISKKVKDCSYTLGFNSGSPGMNENLTNIAGYLVGLTGLYLTHKLGYNIYVYIALTALWTVDLRVPILLPIAQLYFLKDNRYLIPGVLVLFLASVCVRVIDKNSCMTSSHVYPENVIPLDTKDDN